MPDSLEGSEMIGKSGKSLITFITAGDPSKNATLNFMLAMEEYADVIELGIPFSDPMADGKAIQKANYRALKAGIRLRDVFDIVRSFRKHSEKPVVLMTYFNPIYAVGIERFVRDASEAGVSGMIVVDLPLEEAGGYLEMCEKYGIGTIFLAAPNTSDERLMTIDEVSEFIYLVSTYGVTGVRDEVPPIAFEALKRVKKVCRKPVAVGFGVSKPEHVRKLMDAGADGVVVGSAIVEIIERLGEDAAEEIQRKVRELKNAV
jgi:tryptophan synthase alpha chain